jgi:hypothetical protein
MNVGLFHHHYILVGVTPLIPDSINELSYFNLLFFAGVGLGICLDVGGILPVKLFLLEGHIILS